MPNTHLNPTPSTRRIGRPVDADSERTRMQIMDVAERLFAQNGFAATPIRRIAEEAGVNTAMVHYYFRTKKGLMTAVFERALEPMAGSIARAAPGAAVSVADLAQTMMNLASRHPNLPRLVAREVLLPGGQMREVFREKFAPRLGGALPAIIANRQQSGKIAPELDPACTALCVLSLCMFPFLARDLAAQELGVDMSAAGIPELTRHVRNFLEKGLQP